MAGQAVVLPLLLAALSLAPSTEGATKSVVKLPTFLERCSIKDPNLNQCALEKGRKVLPHMVRGYPAMKLPSLDPLFVEEVKVETGDHRSSALSVRGRNITVTGLANASIRYVDIDLKKQRYTTICDIPRIDIECDYEVDGKVLLLPIKGNGKANFTFVNATMHYEQPYILVKRDDLLYHSLGQSHAVFNTSRVYFHLENLFNGDKLLGEQINNFLNENWRDVVDELSGPFLEATKAVIHQFSLAVGGNVPYSDIFLDTEDVKI